MTASVEEAWFRPVLVFDAFNIVLRLEFDFKHVRGTKTHRMAKVDLFDALVDFREGRDDTEQSGINLYTTAQIIPYGIWRDGPVTNPGRSP